MCMRNIGRYNRLVNHSQPPIFVPSRALWLRLACVIALLFAAAAVVEISQRDQVMFLAINHLAPQLLPSWGPDFLTLLGHGLIAIMLLAPLLKHEPNVIVAALIATVPASLFSRVIKVAVHRPRPAAVLSPDSFFIHGDVLAGHNSFPSGHSITIFLVLGVVLLASHLVRRHRGLAAGLTCLAILTGLSRAMVGAHWPSDILAGSALGLTAAAIGVAVVSAWPRIQIQLGSLTHRTLCVTVIVSALFLPWVQTGYPVVFAAQIGFAVWGVVFAILSWPRSGRLPS